MTDIAEKITSQAKKEIRGLSPEERVRALQELQKMINEEHFEHIKSSETLMMKCPRCDSSDVVKRGKGHGGKQRHLCNGCSRSFTHTGYGNLLQNTKLPAEVWMRYAECFINRLSLRECAAICDVGLKTSWFMRHRIHEILKKHMPSFEVKCNCGAELDETYFTENFKGNHKNSDFAMPRTRRKRGSQNHKRGLSNEFICVMTGINDNGDFFYDIACRGRLDADTAFEVLKDKIAEGAVINTDKHRSYISVMHDLGVKCHNAYDSKTEKKLPRVNALHSRMKGFFNRFRGVATRRLEGYLAWFKWTESFKKASRSNRIDIAARQIAAGNYDTVWREIKNTEHPFMDYYGR